MNREIIKVNFESNTLKGIKTTASRIQVGLTENSFRDINIFNNCE